jgi:hypothetical protein
MRRREMAKNIPTKIRFLNDEIEGLRARMVSIDNGAQRAKLEMLSDILGDYETASQKAVAARGVAA